MKKLLVLLMVLSVASLANAALVLSPAEADTELFVQSDPIDVADAQQAMILAVGGGGGALDAGEVLYTGDLSAITNITGLDPDITGLVEGAIGEGSTRIDMIELFSGSAEPPDVVGQLARYGVTPGADPTMVYLLNGDTLEMMGTAKIIPEPITIALLGLGGLFLRRRR